MSSKNKIDRTLIWFETENGKIHELGDDFFGLSTLFNRLLNEVYEVYEGKKIKFINIYLATVEKYEKFPAVPMNYTHYYGGHLNYYGVFNKGQFSSLS